MNITDANSSNWNTSANVTLLLQATDPSGVRQPITTTPLVSLNPDFPRLGGTMVYVGTGDVGVPDLSSTKDSNHGVYDSCSNFVWTDQAVYKRRR